LMDHVGPELLDRLSIVTRTFTAPLVIGDQQLLPNATYLPAPTSDNLGLTPETHDLVVSVLDLHAVNDVPGYLIQINRALKPDGLLLAVFFAGDTLTELRDAWLEAEVSVAGGATPRVAPMISIRECGSLLQRAGFALPVIDSDRITLRYADVFALMQETRSAGFSNMMTDRSKRLTSRSLLQAAAENYHAKHADPDGRIRATMEFGWIQAWKPHSSQQQPLKPGSAKARLADALKVPEGKLPDNENNP
jgi:SAM-dependent methyltransferase